MPGRNLTNQYSTSTTDLFDVPALTEDSRSEERVQHTIRGTYDYRLNAIAFVQQALDGLSAQDAHRVLDYVKSGIDGRIDQNVPF